MTVSRIAMIALVAHVSLTTIAQAVDGQSVPDQAPVESAPGPDTTRATDEPASVKPAEVTPFLAALDIVGDPEEPLPLRWVAVNAISSMNLGDGDSRTMAFDRLLAVGTIPGSHPKLQHRVLEVYYHFLLKSSDDTGKKSLSAKFLAGCERVLGSHEIDDDVQIAAIDWAMAIPEADAEKERANFIKLAAGKLSDGSTSLPLRRKLLEVMAGME